MEKEMIHMNLQNRIRTTNLENKLIVAWEKYGRKDIWEFEMDIHTDLTSQKGRIFFRNSYFLWLQV